MSLLERYKRFTKNNEIFKRNQREKLGPSEMEMHALSDNLALKSLRSSIQEELQELVVEGTSLYKEIYDGKPEYEDLERFIEIANQIIQCKDFVSSDQIKSWEVFRDLVKTFKGSWPPGEEE